MKKSKIFVSLFILLLFFVTISVIPLDHSLAENQKVYTTNIKAPVVHTFTGSVSQGSDGTLHTFSVPSDIILIEVELSFSSSYDFDLSLWDDLNRRTGGWTASDRSTKYNIPNSAYSGYSANPEWITVEPPTTSGIWKIGCYSYRGSGSYTITVIVTSDVSDTTPPTISITSPSNGATLTTDDVTVTWTGSDADSGINYYEIRIDLGSWINKGTVTSHTFTSLAESGHTVDVHAWDNAGNNNLDSISFTIDLPDTTPPDITITSPSNGALLTSSDVATFWTGSDADSGIDYYEVRIDFGSWINKGTTTSHTFIGLADSSHTVDVQAWDVAGNSNLDSVTFTVDTSGGTEPIVYTFTGSVSQGSDSKQHEFSVPVATAKVEVELAFSSSYDFDLSMWDDQNLRTGGWTYTDHSVKITIPNSAYSGYSVNPEWITVEPAATSGTWKVGCYAYSVSGTYTITVTLSGLDTTPPIVTITSPSDGSIVASTDVNIIWSGSDVGSGIDYYEIRLNGGSWINKGTSTSHTFTGLTDASHTVDLRAWDFAGNDATDSVTFTVDTTAVQVIKYAVIVGISYYKAISDLNYCDEDATDWYYHLTSAQMDYDYIWVYGDGHTTNYPQWDGYATEYNVKQALINMVNLADSDDIIAFITSGHGSGNGVGSSYLCQWDCAAGENGEDGDFYDTELKAILDDAVADSIFVFIDHCYSGGFGPDLMNMPNSNNVYVAMTCTDNGYGYDSPANNNGLWTYYFLDYSWQNHFGGSASVSMEDVFAYAHAAYPYGGGDEPEEYDGLTSEAFYIA